MALKPCRECGAQVSASTEICPHCGVRSPASTDPLSVISPSDSNKQTSSKGGCLGASFVIFIILIAIAAMSSNSPNKTPQESQCSSDWTKCADNEQLVNNYSGWMNVKVDCKIEADKRARYGTPIWPWIAFGTFYKGNNYVTSGIGIAVEPDAQFQNGFGAMVHSRVTCTYDLRSKSVISVNIAQN